jgi:hypothetical protein
VAASVSRAPQAGRRAVGEGGDGDTRKRRFERVRGAVRLADMRDPAPERRSPGLAVGLLRFRQKLLSMLQKACGPGLAALSAGMLVAIGPDCALCPIWSSSRGPSGATTHAL